MTGVLPTAVADATPLIALAAVDRFRLRGELFGRVAVPPAVWDEVVTAGRGRPGADAVAAASWIERAALREPGGVGLLRRTTRLDQGEAEAIRLALEMRPTYLVIDDQDGREVAARLGLSSILTGTLGVLAIAYGKGLVDDLEPVFDRLDAFGFFYNDALKDKARRVARKLRGEG